MDIQKAMQMKAMQEQQALNSLYSLAANIYIRLVTQSTDLSAEEIATVSIRAAKIFNEAVMEDANANKRTS